MLLDIAPRGAISIYAQMVMADPFYWPRFSTKSQAWAVFIPHNPLSALRNWHRYCIVQWESFSEPEEALS